jgi:hypothetical protein
MPGLFASWPLAASEDTNNRYIVREHCLALDLKSNLLEYDSDLLLSYGDNSMPNFQLNSFRNTTSSREEFGVLRESAVSASTTSRQNGHFRLP